MRRAILFIMFVCSSPLFAETDACQEIIDWSVIAGAGAGGIALNCSPYLTSRPVIGGGTGRTYRGDTVTMPWVAGGCGAAGLAIALLPNTDGALNSTSYNHVKGFSAAMAFNALFTNLAKTAVGRKRPDYDAHPDGDEGRKSFYSGHSSFSFAAATYLSLFAMNDTTLAGCGVLAKIVVPTALYSAAAAVAASRVRDHRHHISDAAAGAAAGALTAYGAYRWAEKRRGSVEPRVSVTYDDGRPVYGLNVTLEF